MTKTGVKSEKVYGGVGARCIIEQAEEFVKTKQDEEIKYKTGITQIIEKGPSKWFEVLKYKRKR